MKRKAYQAVGSLRPAGPAGPAAATIPTSLGGAHSHRAADPSDPGLAPYATNSITRPMAKNPLKNECRFGIIQIVNQWHILKRPQVAPFQAPIDKQSAMYARMLAI